MISKDNYGFCVQAMKRFNSKFKPDTSTQMKSVVAALFLAQSDRIFSFANLIGLLQLDMDRKLKSKFLRLYDMDTMKLSFEVEMYYDFANNYFKLDDKFYYFNYPVGMIGLLFRSKEEADIMYAKIKAEAPTKKQFQDFVAQIKQQQMKKNENNTWLGKLKKIVFDKQESIQQSGKVLKFEQLYSAKTDNQGHYVQSGTSPFQIDIIDKLQLSQKQKKNPQIMDMITSALLIHQLKKQALQNPANQQIMGFVKQQQKQQQQYLDQCRQTAIMNLPPPPPPPPLLSPQNRISMNPNSRNNLMQQIRANNLRLKHVQTNEKGGVNIDLSNMDTVQRDDFATALRKKIAMRNKALMKHQDHSEDEG